MNSIAKHIKDVTFGGTSLSTDAIRRIDNKMPEMLRATKSFGRQNSQTSAKLMTLTMLSSNSPFRVLYQCLAQIEAKRIALEESLIDIKRDITVIERLRDSDDELDSIEAERLSIRVSNARAYVDGALKDIAVFQEAYLQVRDANGIREDWDELDFERAETAHHTRTAFLHAYRDVMAHGRLGMGTLEYLDQFGIHPQIAMQEVIEYLGSVEQAIQAGETPDAEHLHAWLDRMVEKHGQSYQVTMKRLGLQNLHTEWAMYRTGELTHE